MLTHGLHDASSVFEGERATAVCDDALMLDWRGRIAEATGANLFFVRNGVLHTPTVAGFLDGSFIDVSGTPGFALAADTPSEPPS